MRAGQGWKKLSKDEIFTSHTDTLVVSLGEGIRKARFY